MIGPLILPHPPSEFAVVVRTTTHIDYQIFILVVLVEIVGDVIDRIPVCLFEEIGCGVGHGDDSIGDVGEVELLSIEGGLLLGAGD